VVTMTAAPDTVLIDVDAGEVTGRTFVTYDRRPGFLPPIQLWERGVQSADWTKVDLPTRVIQSQSGDLDKDGTFFEDLRPGQVYRAVMYHDESIDPNVSFDDPLPDADISVIALRKGPESANLFASEEFGPFGTGFFWDIKSTQDTVMTLQVSQDEPQTDANGIQRFVTPITTVTSDFGLTHPLEAASPQLLPGNRFHALARLTDSDGNWHFRHKRFTTKKRKVTVTFDRIHIINDGAPGNNKASFRIWVLEGHRLVSQCILPEREISDSPSPGLGHQEFIQLGAECPPPVVLGPAAIIGESPDTHFTTNERLGILTRGIATVTVGPDDIAGNFLPGAAPVPRPGEPPPPPNLFSGFFWGGQTFSFPIGIAHEAVQNEPFTVRAIPLGGGSGNEFEYDVRVRFSVEYS
jgi:hypothetical protein